MKTIKIANFSVYTQEGYTPKEENFAKLYKGVRVNVDNCSKDPKYMLFSIRTKKTRTSIWKRGTERMDRLVFDDVNLSITCDFDKDPRNPSLNTLAFEKVVYDELKENIPIFMKECGCVFETCEINDKLELLF